MTFAGGMESSQASFMSGPKNLWNRTIAEKQEHEKEPGNLANVDYQGTGIQNRIPIIDGQRHEIVAKGSVETLDRSC